MPVVLTARKPQGARGRLVRFVRLPVLACIIFLLSSCAVDKILFQPPPASYADSQKILKVSTADGLLISAMYLPNPNARFTLLCSHGNAEDIGDTRDSLMEMRDHGYAVFAYDYRGYGTSQGKPSEKGCYLDAEAAFRYLVEQLHVPPDRIIAHGRSLGGAMAIYTASRHAVAGLVLEGTFVSALRVVTNLPLPGDRFRNIHLIDQVHCPTLIMHGQRDEVVPFSHGPKLLAAANDPKLHLWVENGGHNTLMWDAGNAYWDKMAELVRLIGRPQASRPVNP